MITDFDVMKKQLSELAEVINAFKSEAVQLRIVELMLGGGNVPRHARSTAVESEAEQHSEHQSRTQKHRTRKRKASSDDKKPRKNSKHTPTSILTELIGEGFFVKAKTLNAIIEHAGSDKASKFKPSELSGLLARFTRDKKLSRKKNVDGQYEYAQQ